MPKIIYIFIIISIFLVSCKKKNTPKDETKTYPTVKAEIKNVVGYQTFPTNLQGIVNNDVRAKIQGYITQVLVDEGQYVTQGQALFRLEANVIKQSAEAAKSGVSAAQANASASKANIKAAQANVNAAQVEVNKLTPLVEKNIISNVQLQTAQANLAKAQAQLYQAQAALQQANAGIQQASANYKGVEANLNYSIIRAPISGIIGKLPFKLGSLVGPMDPMPLTTISDTHKVYAYFTMNEKEYLDFLEKSYGATLSEKIKNLPMVELQLANGSLYPEKGKIETVSGQIDKATGTIQFRVLFPNPLKLLSNNNSGTIRVPIAYDGVLVIPESSTYEQQGLVYAFKVEKDTAKNVVLELTKRVNNWAVIKSGLNKGDVVVAAGISGLKPNTKINSKPINEDSLVNSIKKVF